MPIRFLQYLSEEIKRDIPGPILLKKKGYRIPTPVFIVFYNGDEEVPEQYEVKMSGLYARKVRDPALELIVKVYNINKGHNKDLMKACITLGQFAEFTARAKKVIRTVKNDSKRAKALMAVIDKCIEDGILAVFLKEYKEEIVDDYLLFTKEDYEQAHLWDLEDMQKEIDDKNREIDDKNKEIEKLRNENKELMKQIRALT